MDKSSVEVLDKNRAAGSEAPDSDARVLANIKKAQRRRIIIALAVAAVVAIGGFSLWYSQRSLLPTPSAEKRERLKKDLGSIDQVPKHLQSPAAAQTLAEYESERLPAPILKALRDCASLAGQSYRTHLAMAPLANGTFVLEWKSVCEGGHSTLADTMQRPRLEQARALYKACDFARHDLLSEEEAARADAGVLALTYSIYEYLKSKRALEDEEEMLLRYLAIDSGITSRPEYF